jgi:lipopolysaccharide/colanic/teichoic acid biosynthesis glycosyltransferase
MNTESPIESPPVVRDVAPPESYPDTSRAALTIEASERGIGHFFYRVFEILFSSAVLLVALPVMLVIAFIVKRGSPGPVLFFQKRMGKGGKVFHFVKFRTMYVDARERFPELYKYSYTEDQMKTLVFKLTNDPRLTPQGRWLRKTSLDELPNFWNVVTGDMALVGPRPEIPEMRKYYHGEMAEKFSVRPGVTGLAQVSGRGNLRFQDTAQLDLQYVRERSIWLDLKIILMSVSAVCKAAGAF